MTREEQIENAADISVIETINSSNRIYNSEEIDWSIYNEAYQKGAKWADAHPNWHKYPDEEPPKENEKYLCYIGYGIQDVCTYYSPGDWSEDFNVIAWMELPKFNK